MDEKNIPPINPTLNGLKSETKRFRVLDFS